VDFQVVDNPAHNRFEIRVDGAQAGAAYYRLHPADAGEPERIVFNQNGFFF
jgi:hypothetical protein